MNTFWKTVVATFVFAVIASCATAGIRRASEGEPEAGGANSAENAGGTTTPTDGKPLLPSVYLDTTYVRPTGRTIKVAAGGDFQAALESASPGEVIELEAGATFTGNFSLPKKAAGGANWIIIRSSAADAKLPPPGTRINPSYAGVMPKLVTPSPDSLLETRQGAHHFRFIGIEFAMAPNVKLNYNLIKLGKGNETSTAVLPHDIIIDRCYIHGNATATLRRAIALNSARTAIIDSYISDCHEEGADSQAICGWNGPGPYKIVNNYLEAAGENVMFGGADPAISGLIPSDIEFRRNHVFKPLSWKVGHPTFAGRHWTVKNLFELKNSQRILIDGNVFENNWVHAQAGHAILLKSQNQDGGARWCVSRDITFTNNIVRHSGSALNLSGRDPYQPSDQMMRVLIRNNLFEDIGAAIWGGGGAFLTIGDSVDVTVDHNTVIHTGSVVTVYGPAMTGFVFTNNIMSHNEYGVKGDNAAPGNHTLDKYFPRRVFEKNIFVGGNKSDYPGGNFFIATFDRVFFAGHAKGNYRLANGSMYKAAGTDGRDIGCDIDALKAAIGSSDAAIVGSTPTPVAEQAG